MIDRDVVRALLGRELAALRRSRALLVPVIVLPAVLFVVLPAAVAATSRGQGEAVLQVLDLLPARLRGAVLAEPPDERLIVLFLGHLAAPFFLVVPLMVSSVLATDAFTGEKDRRTLESLLHLPVRERDLYLSKLLGAFLPALLVAWGGFALFVAVTDVASWPVLGRPLLPTARWAVLVLWVAPASAALGLGVMVRLSLRARTSQEAQQLGGVVVLPLTVLAVGQATYLLLYPTWVAVAAGTAVWAVAVALNERGATAFTRDGIASRL